MANLFRSREGAVTDADAKTQLTTLGSQTAPGALLVPGGATFLRSVIVAAISSFEAADNYSFLIRLEGPGIKRGNYVIPAGSGGVPVATGGSATVPARRVPVNIPVTPGQEILIFAENTQGDMGTHQVGVTLEFGTEVGEEGEVKGEITVEGEITAVDTLTRLTTQGSVTAPSRLTPPDATKLKRIIYSIAHDGQADGEVSFILRLGGDAIKGGEQTLTLGAGARIAVQSGSDAAPNVMVPQILDNLDLDITPNETLDISVEMAGVDVGTAGVVVSAVFV